MRWLRAQWFAPDRRGHAHGVDGAATASRGKGVLRRGRTGRLFRRQPASASARISAGISTQVSSTQEAPRASGPSKWWRWRELKSGRVYQENGFVLGSEEEPALPGGDPGIRTARNGTKWQRSPIQKEYKKFGRFFAPLVAWGGGGFIALPTGKSGWDGLG